MRYIKSFKLFENYHPGREVEIRLATREETKAFADQVPTGGEPDKLIADMVHASNAHGAFEGGRMIAAVDFRDHPRIPDATEIVIMLVHPDRQKEGIGKMLIQYVGDNSENGMIVLNPYTQEAEERFGRLGFEVDDKMDPDDPNTMYRKI